MQLNSAWGSRIVNSISVDLRVTVSIRKTFEIGADIGPKSSQNVVDLDWLIQDWRTRHQYNSFWLLQDWNQGHWAFRVSWLKVVSFISNDKFEVEFLNVCCTFSGQLVRHYEHKWIFVELFTAFFKQLNISVAYLRQPLENLVLPLELQTCRSNDEYRPVIFIEIGNSDRLNRLADPHLVAQEHPPILLSSKVDPLLLELIKASLHFLRQLIECASLVLIISEAWGQTIYFQDRNLAPNHILDKWWHID